jgi:hypothetical protein
MEPLNVIRRNRVLLQLLEIIRCNKGPYFLWLLGNTGGVIIALLASFTIRIYHGHWGGFFPGPDVFLVAGTIGLAVTGVSYLRLPSEEKTTELSPWLSLSWPFPVMFVYGVLIAMGSRNVTQNEFSTYFIAILIFIFCFLWASLTWAHEQGLRQALREGPKPPGTSTLEASGFPKFSV